MNQFLKTLALKSYMIVGITFAVNLTFVFCLRFFVDPIPLVVTAIFFLMTGVYVGYLISHYSTKYLKNAKAEELKKKLPMN